MKRKKLLLATAALTTAISCGGKKKEPVIYGNPKGGRYDPGLDAGVDAPPSPDAIPTSEFTEPPLAPVRANTKSSLYDNGFAKKR